MVLDVETRTANVMGEKMARDCDACTMRSRASWYCPADDAFLCQSCDASIHSANHLAKRHERVRLQSSSSSPEDKTTAVWYEGFRRKARTPRNKLLQINSNDPLVPEIGGGEEEGDGFLSFSCTDEKEESLNCLVPVFDPFSDMMVDDFNSFGLVPDGGEGDFEKEIMEDDDGLIGFLPSDMDLAELTMDVKSLLEEEQSCLGVKEEDGLGFENNCKILRTVKDEEEKCEIGGSRKSDIGEEFKDEDRKMSLFLRLDYEYVITAWGSHGSPWKTGIKPGFSSDDCWPECLSQEYTCPSHVMGGFEEAAVGWMTRQQWRVGGGSDGEREARVLRYREKRRTRLFAKKMRYEVHKLNAEQRPRIKGRFVKMTSLLT